MFSLQKLLGHGDRFLDLLEASADEARASVKLLAEWLRSPANEMDDFVLVRRREKRIAERISVELVETFVTGLEREDIEALCHALYKIPKSVEKFAERFRLASGGLSGADFVRLADAALEGTEIVAGMVRQLRDLRRGGRMKELEDRLQLVEAEADARMLELLRGLYGGRYDILQATIVKDLCQLMERIMERCREAGDVISMVVLKNS